MFKNVEHIEEQVISKAYYKIQQHHLKHHWPYYVEKKSLYLVLLLTISVTVAQTDIFIFT